MHEFSVMSYLIDAVEAHAQQIGAKRVLAVNVVVGERSCVFDDSLLYCFDLLTPGTLAEGAELKVRRTRMRFHCARCGHGYHPAAADFRCPDCGTVGEVTDDGAELLIESMEVEA